MHESASSGTWKLNSVSSVRPDSWETFATPLVNRLKWYFVKESHCSKHIHEVSELLGGQQTIGR